MSAPSASIVRTVSTSDSPFDTDDVDGGDVDDVGRQVLRGDLEADPGPRRGLVEQDRDARARGGPAPWGSAARATSCIAVGRAHHELDLRRASARRRRAGGDAASARSSRSADRRAVELRGHPRASATVSSDRAGARSRRRPRRRSPRAGRGRPPRATSARSCRRGRRGSAARGGRGRRGPRAGSPAAARSRSARPSPPGSSGPCTARRRRGRPCAPLRSNGISVPLTIGCWRDQRQVVAVEGDVERADRDVRALVLEDRRREPMGEGHAAALDADQDEARRCRPASRRSRGRCGSPRGGRPRRP